MDKIIEDQLLISKQVASAAFGAIGKIAGSYNQGAGTKEAVGLGHGMCAVGRRDRFDVSLKKTPPRWIFFLEYYPE